MAKKVKQEDYRGNGITFDGKQLPGFSKKPTRKKIASKTR